MKLLALESMNQFSTWVFWHLATTNTYDEEAQLAMREWELLTFESYRALGFASQFSRQILSDPASSVRANLGAIADNGESQDDA